MRVLIPDAEQRARQEVTDYQTMLDSHARHCAACTKATSRKGQPWEACDIGWVLLKALSRAGHAHVAAEELAQSAAANQLALW